MFRLTGKKKQNNVSRYREINMSMLSGNGVQGSRKAGSAEAEDTGKS